MKKLNYFFFIIYLITLTHSNSLRAQITMHSYYNFEASFNSGAYTELISPTVLVESGGDDLLLTNGGTGVTGPGYPIGFNFYFNGEYFTRFGINSNGFIGLGTESDGVNVSSDYWNPISYTGTISPARLRNRIVAFGGDLAHKGTGYSPAISYKILNTSPNRILVIQFKGWRRIANYSDEINFQIRLHESTHKIEIIYGPSVQSGSSSNIEVGLGGNSTSEYFNLTTTSNWASPSYGQTVDAKMLFSGTVKPNNGTTYTWTLRTMSYSSATTEQASTNFVLKGQTNQQIVRLVINTDGWVLPFNVTSITFTTSGTTTTSNITAARVYYTNSNTFSTNTQFGSQINNPSGNMVFNGSQTLGSSSIHSFWLVYDISSSATTDNQYVDGTCESFTTNESGNPTRTPSVTNPVGNRQILGGLSGTVTVGNGGNYPTLTGNSISTGLFSAINSLGLTGNLTVNIISDITETGFTALNQWSESGGSGYTVTIQPADASLKTISGNSSSYLIQFNGADRVTINGNFSGSGQYLKFSNTHSNPSYGIYFGNGASNNTIKNCIIESGGTSGVIYFAPSSSTVNESNLIENCQIKNYSGYPAAGIFFSTLNSTTTYHNNNTIRNCQIYNFSQTGAIIAGGNNTIEGCEIYRGSGGGTKGISFTAPSSVSSESFIRNNKIYDLNSAGSDLRGITVGGFGGTINIYNNTIYFSANTNSQVSGIYILSATGYTTTLNLYYNSVYITGSVGATGTDSYGLYKSSYINTLRIKNNSIYNARTTTTGTIKNYAVYFHDNTVTSADFNYNDYYVSGTNSHIGYWGGDRTSLADWKTASGQDANSISSNPLYVSTSNLKPFNTSPLINAGTPISGITTDIDGTTRNSSTPYIGAYESNQVPVTVDFCNLQTGNVTIKEGQTSTFYARVEKSGVTNGAGQGAGIQCWIGYNASNTDPSTWTNWTQASYVGDVADRDEYSVTFPASMTPGTYYIASRFFITNAINYQYGGYSTDGGGIWNGTTNINSILTIQDNAINFANVVNSPVSVKLGVNKKFYALYGLPDVTTVLNTSSPVVTAYIGYNTSNTNPSTWPEGNWVLATFVQKTGNYHEYEASFGSTFNVGTYYYASRFKLNDDSYVYGGYSESGGGIWNGTNNVNGVIIVGAELPLFENFDNVTTPNLPNGWTKSGTNPAWGTAGSNYQSSPYSVQAYHYGNTNADAWLFSPPLNLVGGTTYKIVFYSWHSNLFSGGRLNGKFGTTATPAGMTSLNVFDLIVNTTKTRYSATFTPSSSGTYYFGWHNYSTYYTTYPGPLCIDNIEIYEAPANTSSQTISSYNTSSFSFGSTGVTIKFDAGNSQNLTINVDQINSSPGINGSLPSGVNQIASKYWNIALTSGSITTGVYSISIDVSGISGVNSAKDLYLLKRADSNSEWQNIGKPVYTEGNVCTWTGQTSFSEFTLGGDSENPLPVELIYINAYVKNRNVHLNWQTSTEVNNYGFEIERAIIQQVGQTSVCQWNKIGIVNGYGNSNSPKEYSFIDNNPPSGKIKYRLKQIDFDGSFKYSQEVEVNIDAPKEYSLEQNYPNPFNPVTTIKFSIPEYAGEEIMTTLKVYDVLGREVATLVNEPKTAGYYEVKFNASQLSSGVYFYKLESGRFVQIKKFVLMK